MRASHSKLTAYCATWTSTLPYPLLRRRRVGDPDPLTTTRTRDTGPDVPRRLSARLMSAHRTATHRAASVIMRRLLSPARTARTSCGVACPAFGRRPHCIGPRSLLRAEAGSANTPDLWVPRRRSLCCCWYQPAHDRGLDHQTAPRSHGRRGKPPGFTNLRQVMSSRPRRAFGCDDPPPRTHCNGGSG